MKITGVGAPRIPIQEPKMAEGMGGIGAGTGVGPKNTFADKLANVVDGVSDKQIAADDKLAELATGENVDLHGTMIAMEEAEITLRTMTAVRDKVVGAYQEIMNMSI
jgi:flagellar hook-basal body complex protein FliE